MNGTFSEWKESTKVFDKVLSWDPSYLIYLLMIFSFGDSEVCNYAHDTTILACDSDVNKVQYKLATDAIHLSK